MTASIISLLSSALLVLLGMYIISQNGSKPNGTILLGVSLPGHAMKDKAVTDIVRQYRRAHSILILISLPLLFPIMLLREDEILTIAYYLLWIAALLCLWLKITSNYFARMSSLKAEKQWQVGSRNTISIDTEVSRLKHTFILPKSWFLLPLAILIVPIAVGGLFEQPEALLWSITITGGILLALFFFIHLAIGKMRTKTYSEDTETNLYLNHLFKSQWSRCMVLLAILSSLFHVALLYAAEVQNTVVYAIIVPVYSLATIVVAVLPHYRIRAERNRLLRANDEAIQRDDDRYWIGGIIYNNPNDHSLFVEKRIGIGMTMNVGTFGGKLIAAGIVLLLVGTIAFTAWAMLGS